MQQLSARTVWNQGFGRSHPVFSVNVANDNAAGASNMATRDDLAAVFSSGNFSGDSNSTAMTTIQQIGKRLQNLIINDDGSFLYIPFLGAIYISLVFFILVITFCRHFSHVNDQRIRWIRHSTNSTCITGPGAMTVICSNWVYLCRQHGHFGVDSRKPLTAEQLEKLEAATRKNGRSKNASTDDVTLELSERSDHNRNSEQEEKSLPSVSGTIAMPRPSSGCFPWTSYPTQTGVISYDELEELSSPAGQRPLNYYCVSGRHTPAEEQLEFWDYTPELERKAKEQNNNSNETNGKQKAKHKTMAISAARKAHVTSGGKTVEVDVQAVAVLAKPPSPPTSPMGLPRPSLTTPNLSALTKSQSTPPSLRHHHRRKSQGSRQALLLQQQQHDQSFDEANSKWQEIMQDMERQTADAKVSSSSLNGEGADGDANRDRTSSAGSRKEASEQHHGRTSPSGSRRNRQRNLQEEETPQRRSGPLFTKIGGLMRKRQDRF